MICSIVLYRLRNRRTTYVGKDNVSRHNKMFLRTKKRHQIVIIKVVNDPLV